MNKIKCRLLLHGKCAQIDMGIFESIAAAKKYVNECWIGPYTIIKIKNKKQ